jgi:hypothetical protein
MWRTDEGRCEGRSRAGAGPACCSQEMLSNAPARPSLVVLLATVIVIVGVAAGCGGDGSTDPAADAGPVHVHGLGVNPGDSSLYIATHTGLFRMAQGSEEAERVGDGYQDTMGFTVVGADHFLGSGHPDLRTDLPSLLGLIESTDAGGSWEPVSLLGEADFHALRAHGSRVLGYDASGDRLMSSTDGGRTWSSTRPPAPLADVVVHPDDPRRLVAASEAGLISSRDGGRSWTAPQSVAVVLAWPSADALYALAPHGAVSVSRDGGASWAEAGSAPGEPAALTALDQDTLIVALHDGGFAHSANGGRSWVSGAWS